MKIYEVSYIGEDDNTYAEYFSNKAKRNKRYRELLREAKAWKKEIEENEDSSIGHYKLIFEPFEFEMALNVKDVLDTLNNRFGGSR